MTMLQMAHVDKHHYKVPPYPTMQKHESISSRDSRGTGDPARARCPSIGFRNLAMRLSKLTCMRGGRDSSGQCETAHPSTRHLILQNLRSQLINHSPTSPPSLSNCHIDSPSTTTTSTYRSPLASHLDPPHTHTHTILPVFPHTQTTDLMWNG